MTKPSRTTTRARRRTSTNAPAGAITEIYGLSWPGKREAMALADIPSAATLAPCPAESIDANTTSHLFLEGDNLNALKLLRPDFEARVKMIYIDPPYNTGTSLVYHDKLAHAAWLSMMYPRLKVARHLLREDGVIFVSIDDHELHHLRLLLEEIFGEENFIETIVWQKQHTRKNSARYFSTSHDYIVCFAKLKNSTPGGRGWRRNLLPREQTDAYTNPDNDPRGPWKPDPIYANKPYSAQYKIRKPSGVELGPPEGQYWRFSEATFAEFIAAGAVLWGEGRSYPLVKRYLADVQDGLVPTSLFDRRFAGDNALANSELDQLIGVKRAMDYPKPSLLLKRLLQIATSPTEPEIVLDFFAGSCPLAHAALELNREDGGRRQFILVQLPEPLPKKSAARAAGLRTIADIGKLRIRRVIERLAADRVEGEDLGMRVCKIM